MEAQANVGAGPLQNNIPEVEDNFSENEFPDLMGNIPQSNTLKKADDQLLSKEAVYQLLSRKVDDKLSNKNDDQSSEEDDQLTENDEDQLSEKAPSLLTDERLSYNIPEEVNSKISFFFYSFKNGVEIKKYDPPALVACEKPSDKIPKHDLPVKVACEKSSGNIPRSVKGEILKDLKEVEDFSQCKKKQDDSCSKQSIIGSEKQIQHDRLSEVSNVETNSIGQSGKNNSFKATGQIVNKLSGKKETGTHIGQKNMANNSTRNVEDFLKSSGKKEAGSLTSKNNGESNFVRNFEDFLKFSMVDKKSPNELQN